MNKKKYPTPATIVIRLNGDETTATLMGDEFRTGITRTLAKRNPKDEYDAYIGARVALDRLFDKDSANLFDKDSANLFEKNEDAAHKKGTVPEKTQAPKKSAGPAPKFQVGDIVRVTNAGITFGDYDNGDVAVVTKVLHSSVFLKTGYVIKVRSKERKGYEGGAFAEELTLLHRPAKEGEKR